MEQDESQERRETGKYQTHQKIGKGKIKTVCRKSVDKGDGQAIS